MIAAGIDRGTATALLKKRGSVVIENQLAWIDARNPTENRIGMLRKAIDEDWQKPASIDVHERQSQQRERDRQRDAEQSKEAAAIVRLKRERRKRRDILLEEWNNASTEDRQRWIQRAAERESSKMIADIIRRDSVAAAKRHTQVLDAIAADRHLPPVQQTANV